MKIKIIDLLVKIANGEEIPRTIRWYDEFYNDYDEISNNYKAFVYGKLQTNVWSLNDEIEIIEEPKKIGKLPYYSLEKIQKSKTKDEWYENRLELLEKRINDYHNKINELIDEINNLKEND